MRTISSHRLNKGFDLKFTGDQQRQLHKLGVMSQCVFENQDEDTFLSKSVCDSHYSSQ